MSFPDSTQSDHSQASDPQQKAAGRCRLKPRQLSPLLRQVIVDQFSACHSTEDIAEELRIPARTVADVLLLEALRRPIQPGGASMQQVLRRTA